MKSVGPRTDPCGMPNVTGRKSDFVPLTVVYISLPFRGGGINGRSHVVCYVL